MIADRPRPVHPSAAAADPVEMLAAAMIELQAQGLTVTRELLLRVTDCTAGELDRHGVEAADRATMILRERRHARRTAL